MKHNTIDLHMHSSISKDGQHLPSDLVSLCAENGLKFIAIADHDSIRAIDEARKTILDQQLDLKIIPAIELDCTDEGINLHILGYGIESKDPWFTRYEHDLDTQERTASVIRANLIRSIGIHLDQHELDKVSIDGILTGEMIAEVAFEAKENQHHPLLEPYREGGSRSDNPLVNFYWDFCAQGKPAFVDTPFVSAKEAIDRIKAAGGLAVLAHPGNNIQTNDCLLEGIVKLGIDGIEVYSSYHNPDVTAFYREKALQHHLLMTLGSDFHGKTKPSIHLGEFICPDEKSLMEAFLSRPEIKRWL